MMNEMENKAATGACGEACAHPPDEMKLALDLGSLAADLATLTNCRYKLADQSFRKFRMIHGLYLVWQANRTQRLMLRLFKESKWIMDNAQKQMDKDIASVLKTSETRIAQPNGRTVPSRSAPAGDP